MAKKKINLEEYSKTMFDSGMQTGLLTISYPIKELLQKVVNEGADPIVTLGAIADVLKVATAGCKDKQILLKDKLKSYNFDANFEIEVECIKKER